MKMKKHLASHSTHRGSRRHAKKTPCRGLASLWVSARGKVYHNKWSHAPEAIRIINSNPSLLRKYNNSPYKPHESADWGLDNNAQANFLMDEGWIWVTGVTAFNVYSLNEPTQAAWDSALKVTVECVVAGDISVEDDFWIGDNNHEYHGFRYGTVGDMVDKFASQSVSKGMWERLLKKIPSASRVAAQKFQWTRSPLSYHGYSPQRLALIDPKAPDPDEKATYFAETKKELRKKNRQRYKKPRYETIPGAADPKTVAFLDYSVDRNYYQGKDLVYFHYVNSRDRGKGNAQALFNKILQKHGKDTYYDFGDIMNPAIYKIYRQWQRKGLNAKGANWGGFRDDEVGLKKAAFRVALRHQEKTPPLPSLSLGDGRRTPMKLTASDRKALIRLASALPKGSEERKTVLAGLEKTASPGFKDRFDEWLDSINEYYAAGRWKLRGNTLILPQDENTDLSDAIFIVHHLNDKEGFSRYFETGDKIPMPQMRGNDPMSALTDKGNESHIKIRMEKYKNPHGEPTGRFARLEKTAAPHMGLERDVVDAYSQFIKGIDSAKTGLKILDALFKKEGFSTRELNGLVKILNRVVDDRTLEDDVADLLQALKAQRP